MHHVHPHHDERGDADRGGAPTQVRGGAREGKQTEEGFTQKRWQKVFAAVWGAELIQFLDTLAILHQGDLKNRMKSSYPRRKSSYSSNHPGKEFNQFCPPNSMQRRPLPSLMYKSFFYEINKQNAVLFVPLFLVIVLYKGSSREGKQTEGCVRFEPLMYSLYPSPCNYMLRRLWSR